MGVGVRFEKGYWAQALLRRRWVAVLLVLGMSLSVGARSAHAQGDGQVQVLAGKVEPGEILLYRLPGLQAGQTIYVRMQGTSGNLDPIVGLMDPSVDPEALEAAMEKALDLAPSVGLDPLEAIDEVRNQYALAWDDDGGGGLVAALEYEIPADGDYRLLVGGALSFAGSETFGDYELLVALDAPQVLSGEAESTRDTIAVLDVEATPPGAGVEQVTGSLTPEKRSTFYELRDFRPGDTLYATIEATSGDLRPTIVLLNYAQKPIRSGNLDGQATSGSLQYAFPVEARNYLLAITSCCDGGPVTSGDYALTVGVNVPEVLTGDAPVQGRDVVRKPIDVDIGLKLQQIIDVDQANESFTAQVSMQMEWTDPALAFDPDECQCDFKSYTGDTFNEFVKEVKGRWPDFTLQNQQGNRWAQNKVAVLRSDGRVTYFERFTTDFQADFDFRSYPFDTEEFVIRVDMLFPEEYYVFSDLEGYSEISTEHGEDEFVIAGFETHVTSEQASTQSATSRFTFSFTAPRHLSYYVLQIFLPITLIIGVSWVTFFLRDYTQRIEVASANLLLFIAFAFSLSENYPRLGYLTFLDYVMAVMFIVNAAVVAYNVWMKLMEMRGKSDRAERIDVVMDWAYPLIYLALLGFGIWQFFIHGGAPLIGGF